MKSRRYWSETSYLPSWPRISSKQRLIVPDSDVHVDSELLIGVLVTRVKSFFRSAKYWSAGFWSLIARDSTSTVAWSMLSKAFLMVSGDDLPSTTTTCIMLYTAPRRSPTLRDVNTN